MIAGTAKAAHHIPVARLMLSCAFLFLLAVVGVSTPSHALAQENITEISGKVIEGTAGSSLPTDLQVILLTIDQDKAQIVDRSQQVIQPDGSFRFTNILQASNYFYRVVADNGDHTPYVDVLQGDPTTGLEITIWDSTSSLDKIVTESYSLLVPAQSLSGRTRQIGVLTVVTIRNDGDHVWIPDISGTNAGVEQGERRHEPDARSAAL